MQLSRQDSFRSFDRFESTLSDTRRKSDFGPALPHCEPLNSFPTLTAPALEGQGNLHRYPGIELSHDQQHPSQPQRLQLPKMQFPSSVSSYLQRFDTNLNGLFQHRYRVWHKAPQPQPEIETATTLLPRPLIVSSPALDRSVFQGVVRLTPDARLRWLSRWIDVIRLALPSGRDAKLSVLSTRTRALTVCH